MLDDVARPSEVAALRGAAFRAFGALGHPLDAPDASLAPLAALAAEEEFLGSAVTDLVHRLAERLRVTACAWGFAELGPLWPRPSPGAGDSGRGGDLQVADALLARLAAPMPIGGPPPGNPAENPLGAGGGYWAPHVDKANVEAYDVSAVLYLSTLGADFSGGEFAFNDPESVDRVVEPRAGRLLLFDAGPENLHQVLPVVDGQRLALSAWFTRLASAAAEEVEEDTSRDGGTTCAISPP